MLTDTILRNRYKILKQLGRGGFSVTYLAVDMDLPGNPKCVVKQLKTRQSNNTILQIAKKLFDREAQVLYRLGKGHKQIPEMLAHFEENDEFYLVQEFVDGHDLSKEIKLRHRLSEEKVIKLLQEILEVLSFVHENNVIHRDIKLRNIMRRREDGKIVLIDFGAVKEIKGLAKNEQGDVNSTLIIGTPGYMPDEQANGKPRLCSDVYAVGMLGIQALTGISPRELPFNSDNGELIWRDSANVSDKLAEVLTGMVRHHFSQRYQTAAEALEALKSPVLLLPNAYSAYDALPETLPSTIRKSPPAIVQTLGLLSLMGVGFGLGVFGWSFFQSGFNGNQPTLTTTEDPDRVLKNIKTSTTPKITHNSNPKIFLPSTPRRLIDSKNQPVFLPFIPFLNENHIQVSPQTPKSKSKKSQDIQVQSIPKFQPKPKPKSTSQKTKFTPKQSLIEGEKEVNTAPSMPQSQNERDYLPYSLISPSKEKEIENFQTSLPSQTPKEKKQKQELESPTPSPTPSPTENKQNEVKQENQENEVKQKQELESPTPSPTPSPTENKQNEVKQENQENEVKQKQELESPTPSPTPSPTEDKQNEVKQENQENEVKQKQELESPTPSPTPSPTEDKQKEKAEEKQNPTPASPDTPAIESKPPSPKPTVSPTPTEDSVIVPTDTSSKTPVEGNSYFITLPISPTPTPEVEIQSTTSPQPTPTPEVEIQSTTSPQPTPTPEVEIQSTTSPQPTPTPEAKIEVTPQALVTPTPEVEIQPTYSPQPTPTPELEIEAIPQASVTPTPEAEIQPTVSPQPTPTPEVEIEVTVSPQPTPTPEIEIEVTASPQLTPTPEVKIEVTPQALATPTPKTNNLESTPPQEQGLSLKGFAI